MRIAALVLCLLAVGGGYWYIRAQPQATAQALVWVNRHVEALKERVRERAALFAPSPPETGRGTATRLWQRLTPDLEMPKPGTPNTVTLHLTNGSVVTGELLRQDENTVTLRWTYGEMDFHRSEIRRLLTVEEARTPE